MESFRERSGHRPFSRVFEEEYHPYEISGTFLEDIYWASRLHTRTMWDEPDDVLVRGYNYITRRSREKKYIFVIGVVTDKKYRQFELCATHSKLPKEFLDKVLVDMEYHLSLVLRPWKKDPLVENYYPVLCSPKSLLAFNITDVNRKRRKFSVVVSYLYYDGIAPPYVYDSDMIANMLHSDFGSSVIKRYEPDEKFDKLNEPKIVKFGQTEEYDMRRLKHKIKEDLIRRPF